MKNLILSVVAAGLLSAGSAMAADMPVKAKPAPAPSPWDIAFGGALLSDYNFRGISQSDHGPSGTVYLETRYNLNPNLQFYAGSQYWAVDLPTRPTCECDLYGGFRPTVGPLAFDFGFIYYWYPREKQVFLNANGSATFLITPTALTVKDTDYYEGYGKVTWEAIKDRLTLGANFYYSPDWLGSGAYGFYASGTAKVSFPSFTVPFIMVGPKEIGWYVSGEVGHYSLGTTDPILGSVNLPDYWTWNVGLTFTQGVFSLDLRYYDTDLSKADCFTLTGDLRGTLGGGNLPLGTSTWCDARFVVATKFDLTVLSNLK